MSTVLHAAVERALSSVLSDLGAGHLPGRLVPCPRPELGDVAVQDALAAARTLKRSPVSIASDIAARLSGLPEVASAEVVAPGYVNLRFSDAALSRSLDAQAADPARGVRPAATAERVVVDFGGPNLGKRLHVGHLRSFVVGEALCRMLRLVGHDVISDAHLGDWGLPCGQVVAQIRHLHPDAPWFVPGASGPFPDTLPVPDADLDGLYPLASVACKADPARLAEARAVTAAIQAGDPGPAALWALFSARAKASVLATCARLGVRYDLFLGESDAQADVPATLAAFDAAGAARREGEAVLVDLAAPSDRKPMPPLVLSRGDGSALYATTDLATIAGRARDLAPDRVLYVVDARQGLHFEQVFRAAAKAGLAPGIAFEHLGFGTVDGADGKPLRTRDGGVAGLDDLLDSAAAAARARVRDLDGPRADAVAEAVGLAALRVADLLNHRSNGYALDVDRATSFEGETGPYLLYALVRLRTLLAKAGTAPGPVAIAHPAERRLALACLGLGAAVQRAVDARSPHEAVRYAFALAGEVSRFYVECPVSGETDPAARASRVTLCTVARDALSLVLDAIACEVPEAM